MENEVVLRVQNSFTRIFSVLLEMAERMDLFVDKKCLHMPLLDHSFKIAGYSSVWYRAPKTSFLVMMWKMNSFL